MQKVDLHIHTKTSNQDRAFTFSEERLKEYVTNAVLDCIAITNHNLFDKSQFEHIRNCVEILVLPGIEVDVEKSQILVLSDGHNLNDFDQRCAEVHFKWNSTKSTLPYDDFTRIFGDLRQYILIPHYQKDPKISQDMLNKLASYITAGEVSSPKKFVSCVKDADKLVPVYFSDCRMSADLNPLPTRQTFLDCGEVTFGTLREVLRDKNKVALTEADGNKLFQIFPDGQSLSTGLNVVLGDRSSGKSHTLQRISDWFGEDNVKFVQQFDLVARNEAEDEKKFKDFLSERTSIFSKDYLADLQKIVDDVLDIDTAVDLASVEEYVTSLLEYAHETSKHDAFSRAKLYNEDALTKKNLDGLRQLIGSTKHLLRNVEYREVIDRHLDADALEALYVELMRIYCTQEETNAKKSWVNALVQDVKSKLQRKSSAPKIAEVDLIKVELNKRKVQKFEEVVSLARKPKTPLRKRKQGFEVVAQVGPFRGAGELKEASRSTRSFSAAFRKYEEPYGFIQELRKIGAPITASEFSKFLVKVEYKILNRDGLEASGGERSEFFLLDQIEGAEGAEVLLIDEPESSFDNNFLKEDVNELIKAMSHKMPVVIVTHNNTVGASIQPDYLICTRKEVADGEIKFRLYSGHPTSKKLTSTDGYELLTRDVLLGSLEAGVDAYEQRGKTYENLKN